MVWPLSRGCASFTGSISGCAITGLVAVGAVSAGALGASGTLAEAAGGVTAAGALLEHGDRLVDAPEHRPLLLEDLHRHPRMSLVLLEQLLREVEIGVGVVAVPDPLDG